MRKRFAPGKQAAQPGPESVAYGILDLGTEDDAHRTQHPHAEEDPATHGDVWTRLPVGSTIRSRRHPLSLGTPAG